MASFSLTEKLAVTGAFLAFVAMLVGTEEDPGLVVTGQQKVAGARLALPAEPTQAAQSDPAPASTYANPFSSVLASNSPTMPPPSEPIPVEATDQIPVGRPVLGGIPEGPRSIQPVD